MDVSGAVSCNDGSVQRRRVARFRGRAAVVCWAMLFLAACAIGADAFQRRTLAGTWVLKPGDVARADGSTMPVAS